MNIKLKFLLFFIIVILLLFLVRIMIYNNYINKLNEVRESFSSNSQDKSKKAVDLNSLNINTPNNLLNIVSNPNLIYTTIVGEIIIITNSNVIILVGKKIKQVQLSDFFGKDYDLNNHHNKFTGGYFNHKNNTLNIFHEDLLLCYCLRNKNVILSENKKRFFKSNSQNR